MKKVIFKFKPKLLLDSYAKLLCKYPVIMIILIFILIGLSIHYSGKIINSDISYEDILPKTNPVVNGLITYSEYFGSSENVQIAISLNSQIPNSNEIRDVRNYNILKYISNIEQYFYNNQNIKKIDSPISLIKESNNGVLPKSEENIKKIISQNPSFSNYFSSDYEMVLITISLEKGIDSSKVLAEMENMLKEIPKPEGVSVDITGSAITGEIINRDLSSDTKKTSMYSMFGIILVLLFIFGSIKWGLLPLTTIICGVIFTMGFVGFMGLKMSTATSGVMSMIMGIGIDFGIQIISRFKQEKKNKPKIESMIITLNNVFMPMFITTIAAVIGFISMGLGDLSVMADMGRIMAYGTVFCFLSAITIVPALTLVLDDLTLFNNKTSVSINVNASFIKKKNKIKQKVN